MADLGRHQALGLGDEGVESGVDDHERLLTAALTWHQPSHQRQVPVRQRVRAPVLRLSQHCVYCLKHSSHAHSWIILRGKLAEALVVVVQACAQHWCFKKKL